MLHLLEALQVLQIKVPGGGPAEARQLSFRALDIEQIGHVYEGLLDHTARRAAEPVLGLAGTRDKEPEIAAGRTGEARRPRARTICSSSSRTRRAGRSRRLKKAAATLETRRPGRSAGSAPPARATRRCGSG